MARSDEHPTAELDRLLAGRAGAEERRRAVVHLLSRCPPCARRLARGLCISTQPRPSGRALREAVARAVARFPQIREEVAREEELAERLLEALADQPHGRAIMVLASSKRHRRRAVAEQLLAEAHDARHADPQEALELAEQALALARVFEGPGAEDLRARAWMEVATARRLSGDFEGAEAGFLEAANWLDADGGADPRLRLEFDSMLAVLRTDQRRFSEALALNAASTAASERARDRNAVAKARQWRAYILAQSGDLSAAMLAAWESLRLVGPHVDLRASFVGIHNILHWLAEAGHHLLASDLMQRARPLYEACGGATDLVRLDWTRARLYLQRPGWLDDAGFLFEDVRERFAELDLPYEVALVSLDLAAVYAQQGRTFELREVAREMLPIFRRLGVARETLTALALLRRADAREAATTVLIQKLARAVGGKPAGKGLPPAPRR